MNLPWYTYVILAVAVAGYIYRFVIKRRPEEDIELKTAKFRKSTENALQGDQLFSVSLDAVFSVWWDVPINTLNFPKVKHFDDYLEGWGIDTKEGYWDLTEYFIKDGRRWYFNFIFNMVENEPEERWDDLMMKKFGANERAHRYLRLLRTGDALNRLKQNGFITFDSELEIGVAAYDSAILVTQARRAYSANMISEQDAWKVINFAAQLAVSHFSSWEEFSKSFIIGLTLDTPDANVAYREEIYHQYKQVVENKISPWNNLNWPA
ncbi:MAG: DUF1266 domain-containing protein [Flavobacteriales bacterium]|jgi:hypothetical protein|nr:DUF1266 domain-containing protein [Flavobacteriales bacterium]